MLYGSFVSGYAVVVFNPEELEHAGVEATDVEEALIVYAHTVFDFYGEGQD